MTRPDPDVASSRVPGDDDRRLEPRDNRPTSPRSLAQWSARLRRRPTSPLSPATTAAAFASLMPSSLSSSEHATTPPSPRATTQGHSTRLLSSTTHFHTSLYPAPPLSHSGSLSSTITAASPVLLPRARTTSSAFRVATTFPVPATTATTTTMSTLLSTPPALLARRTPSLGRSFATTDLSKHFAAADALLQAFDGYWDRATSTEAMTTSPSSADTTLSAHWDAAYVVGRQYVETALCELPQHGYYRSPRYEHARQTSLRAAVRVVQWLLRYYRGQTAPLPSAGALGVVDGEKKRLEYLSGLAEQRLHEARRDAAATAGTRVDDNEGLALVSSEFDSDKIGNVEVDIDGRIIITYPPNKDETEASNRHVPSSSNVVSAHVRRDDPRIHATPLVPSHGDIDPIAIAVGRSDSDIAYPTNDVDEDLLLQKVLYLSGLEALGWEPWPSQSSATDDTPESGDVRLDETMYQSPPLSVDSLAPVRQPARASSVLELSTLTRIYHDDFFHVVQIGWVRLSYADTYQGKHAHSINGCTVIAPLLCIHHLLPNDHDGDNAGRISDPGVTDRVIAHVIDVETPVILQHVRQQLQLAPHAFLIPSDVHDYLIRHEQLQPSQLLNVVGGNILHDSHLDNFVAQLADHHRFPPSQKLAATLFFHEHVVAILKLQRDVSSLGAATETEGQYWYDLIDSLPSQRFLQRPDESREEFWYRTGMARERELVPGAFQDSVAIADDDAIFPRTARVRCLNSDALKVVLRWFACSKFTEENHAFINQYAWDERLADFDPRVFQAFIWGSVI